MISRTTRNHHQFHKVLDERVCLPDAKDLSDLNKSLKTQIISRQTSLNQLKNRLVHAETQLFSLLLDDPLGAETEISLRREILEKRVLLREKTSLAEKIESEISSFKISDLLLLRDRLLKDAATFRKQISVLSDPRVADLQAEVLLLRRLRDDRENLEALVHDRLSRIAEFNT